MQETLRGTRVRWSSYTQNKLADTSNQAQYMRIRTTRCADVAEQQQTNQVQELLGNLALMNRRMDWSGGCELRH